MAVLKLFPVEIECDSCLFARATVPTIRQDDAADVPEKGGDGCQEGMTPILSCRLWPEHWMSENANWY